MRHEIILAPEAVEDLRNLKANIRATVRAGIEKYLRHQPSKTSKSRIKRLQSVSHPQFRLRIDEVRVFYDVRAGAVEVLAIIPKSQAQEWLKQYGESP